MCKRIFMTVSLLSILFAAIPVERAHCQVLWVVPESNRALVEYMKPSFASDADVTFGTSTWIVSGNVGLGKVVRLAAELPYTRFGVDGGESETAFGNIYLGVDLQSAEVPVIAEFGVRLPTASEFNEASLSGAFSDWVDRSDAFIDEIVPITMAINYYNQMDTGLIIRVRGGLNIWMPKGTNEDVDTFFLYGGQLGYGGGTVNFLAGFTGRWLLTSDGADFGEASFHQLAFSADVPLGVAQPGASLRVPIDDDLGDIIDFVFGIHLAANFKG